MTELSDTSDLLTKLKHGINRGIRIVNIRSKQAYETVRIKNQIQSFRCGSLSE